nr:outer membrane protein assembly factor BamE [Cypionkella aquatica]
MAAAMMLVVACSPIYRDHGYIPSDEELALLTVGKDTRESVAVKVGRPSASGLLNDVGWYYVESRFVTKGAFTPKEVNREVVAITFTEAGTVENIERFGLEKGQIVPLSRRVTKDNVKGASLLQQLFGNVGGLTADQLLK